MMKKTLLATTIAVALATSSAFAGAFDGPYVSLGAGFANTTQAFNWGDNRIYNYAENGLTGQIVAGYSMSLPRGFNIAGNIFDRSYLNYNANNINGITTDEFNSWGVALEPGYYLNADTLLYTTFSYVQGYFKNNDYPLSYTTTQNGFGYGFGIKHLLSQHFFMGVEAQQIWFPESAESAYNNTGGPIPRIGYSNLVGTINVGYIF